MPLPKLVMFDLDNTIIDRYAMFESFARRFADRFFPDMDGPRRTHLIDTLRDVDDNGNTPRPKLFYQLYDALRISKKIPEQEMIRFWNTEFPRPPVMIGGAAQTLARLAMSDTKLALVTNGVPELQNNKIDYAGIRGFFDFVVVSGEFGIDKPDRRIFDYVLENLCVPAENAVFVGDNLLNDITGAQNAGIRGIWANFFGRINSANVKPYLKIDSYAQLSLYLW